MTYAVAVRLQRGLVFAADTRTNAGIDNVSQFRKLHFWRRTGDRVLVLLTAGNLAISQSVISIINEQLSPEAQTDRPTLMNVSSMYRAARLIGDAVSLPCAVLLDVKDIPQVGPLQWGWIKGPLPTGPSRCSQQRPWNMERVLYCTDKLAALTHLRPR
jgi:hypothetical protein